MAHSFCNRPVRVSHLALREAVKYRFTRRAILLLPQTSNGVMTYEQAALSFVLRTLNALFFLVSVLFLFRQEPHAVSFTNTKAGRCRAALYEPDPCMSAHG